MQKKIDGRVMPTTENISDDPKGILFESANKKTVRKEWIEDIVVRYTKGMPMQEDVTEDTANTVLHMANSEKCPLFY